MRTECGHSLGIQKVKPLPRVVGTKPFDYGKKMVIFTSLSPLYSRLNVTFSCPLDEPGDDSWICKYILTNGHSRTIRFIVWSPDGNTLASASFDATVGIWSKTDGTWDCRTNLEGHENEVKCVSWSKSGKYLATCSRDKTVWIWEKMGDDDFECASVQTQHTQDVKRVTWHPKEDIFASCSYDNDIRLYSESTDDWDCYACLRGHESTVWAVDFDSTGNQLVSVSDDRTVKIWTNDGNVKSANWTCILTFRNNHERPIYDVSWSLQSNFFVTAAGDNCICVFCPTKDASSYELLCKLLSAHNGDVNCVSWNPVEGDLLASGGDDGTVKIWKMQSSKSK